MTDLDFTGERLVPEKSPPDLTAEHMARYDFALEFVKGCKTLDLGCGAGYGSAKLASAAKSVVGIDIDKPAIEYARENYSSERVTFMASDGGSLPFDDHSFDAVICFEVIEHIEHVRTVLRETSRVLKPDGVFIVSTPNGAVKVSSKPNPFHIKEFTITEFIELLWAFFPAKEWDTLVYGQFIKGKKYSQQGVAFKNFYLTLKGMFGIKARDKNPNVRQDGVAEFEFRIEDRDLAEYLVAVLKGK